MKKSFKTILSLALALVLCVSLCAGAFAEGETPAPTPTVPTAAADAVYITKDLKIASMTTVPGVTFTFSFEGNAEKSVGLQEGETIPAITAVSVVYSDADGSNITTGKVTKTVKVGFPTYTHAGVYAYTVTESENFDDTATEKITNDTATYIMRVYVVNGADGPVIDFVTAEKFESADATTGEKVEITDDITDENGFRFVNNYTKVSGGTDDDVFTDASLIVTKAVEGDYGDKSKAFSYSITVNKPANAPADAAFTYSINGAAAVNGAYGTPITFTLKHGEEFALFGVLTGSTYTVTETGADDYTATAVILENGASKTAPVVDKAADLALTGIGIGENANTADYTNTYDDASITPTGIVINNLPFVMLAVVAVAGLFFFVAASKRKAQED